MDPQATLIRYVYAAIARDNEAMSRAAEDYNTWINGGGFAATLPDGRQVYKLYVVSGNWRTAADVGFDSVENSPLGTTLTPKELTAAICTEPESLGLKERLRAALQAHSGCCLDNDEEVDMVLAAIHKAAQGPGADG